MMIKSMAAAAVLAVLASPGFAQTAPGGPAPDRQEAARVDTTNRAANCYGNEPKSVIGNSAGQGDNSAGPPGLGAERGDNVNNEAASRTACASPNTQQNNPQDRNPTGQRPD